MKKFIMVCGVACPQRVSCLEYQKRILNDDYVIVNKDISVEQVQEYCSEGKDIIWDDLNLYPEVRGVRLSLIPDDYHKTAVYFKPTDKDLEDPDMKVKMMQFVCPSEFENFQCIMRYQSPQ